jgi:hypothetical protein
MSKAGTPAAIASAASTLACLVPARNARPRRQLDEAAFWRQRVCRSCSLLSMTNLSLFDCTLMT